MKSYRLLSLLLLALPVAGEEPSPAKPETALEAASKAGFVRFLEDETGAKLQTPVITYTRKDGRKVDLVGAIHVGDPAYYEGLNELFATYDALLFELVGDPEALLRRAKGEKDERSGALAIVGGIQTAMKEWLDLSYQLEGIDYTPKHFVHADMDYHTFQRRSEARGEGFIQMYIKSVIQQMQKEMRGEGRKTDPNAPKAPSLVQMLGLMVKGESATELKRYLGRQMGQLEEMMDGLEGPDGSVIITERNAAAFEVLEKELEAGKKNLGIFYGAAHLPDMAERMEKMGFRETAREWRTAWDIPPPAQP